MILDVYLLTYVLSICISLCLSMWYLFSCTLFVCINKEYICCWDTDWSLERMSAFFTPSISKKAKNCWAKQIGLWTQDTAGKIRTQCDGTKPYILPSSFWIPWKIGKNHMEKPCLSGRWTCALLICGFSRQCMQHSVQE